MKAKVKQNRELLLINAQNTQNENRAETIELVVPEEYESYNKKIVFITPDGTVWDVITNNKYKLTNAITKYEKVNFYIWLTKEVNGKSIDFRTKTKSLMLFKNVDASDEITPEEINGVNTVVNLLEEEIEKVENLNIEATKIGSTTTVTITKKDGTTESVEINDGTDGQDGYTPQKGVDYFTNEDKQEIEGDILDEVYTKNQTDILLEGKANVSDIPDVSSFITKDVNNLTYYTLKTNTGSLIDLEINSTTYVLTVTLKNEAGTVLSTSTVDLPLETMVVNGSYNETTKKVVLTLQNGNTVEFSVADLIDGLQSEITNENKLSSDLVEDTNNTNKFMTQSEKSKLEGIESEANKTIVDTELNGTSTNPVENKVIKSEIERVETEREKLNIFPLQNYFDYNNIEDGKVYTNAAVGTKISKINANGYFIIPRIKVKKGISYKIDMASVGIAFSKIVNEDNVVLESLPYSAGNLVTPNYDGYACITITKQNGVDYSQKMIYVNGHEPSEFVEYGQTYDLLILDTEYMELYNYVEKLKNSSIEMPHNIITVGTNKNYTSIKSAVNSITDASSDNIYDIIIDDGTYEERSIALPDYVNLIGASGNKDSCKIKGDLPETVTDNEHTGVSTIDCTGNNTFKNITITAKNMRYAVHSESNGDNKNWTTIIDNCVIEHFGNQEIIDYRIANNLSYSGVWSAPHAWGEGASEGSILKATNTIFRSVENGFYVHGASNQTKPYYHELNNCQIISTSEDKPAIYIDNNSPSISHNKIVIRNCLVGGRIGIIANNYKMDIEVSGCGYIPVYQRPNHVCSDNDFPIFTDFMKQYKANENINKGTFVCSTDGLTIQKATSSTDKKLIVGYTIGDVTTGNLINVMKGYLQPSSQTWPESDTLTAGKYYKVGNNGLLEETENISDAIAISSKRYYVLWL